LIETFNPTSFEGSLRGDSKGGTPLAYWGIFSDSETKREENALISYGVF